MKNPKQTKSAWDTIRKKSGTFMSVLVINFVTLLLVSGLVVYHFVVPSADVPMAFVKVKSAPPPPPKPPSMAGRSGAKTPLDPTVVVAPPPESAPALISSPTSSVANFSVQSVQPVNSLDLPTLSIPQGNSLDQASGDTSGTLNSSGSNPFGSTSEDNGPALVGYLYDLKRNSDGSPTNIKDDGYFKDRTLEKTYEARWHWGKYIMSFANDPDKRSQLTDSMINEANLINSLFNDKEIDTLLTPYYRSKPLYAYQWTIGNQSAPSIVKAFGVENEVKPTHLVICYKGTVMAPVSGTFRFITFSEGGAMAIRFNNDLVAGHGNWENPLISSKPFQFGGDSSCLMIGEAAGKWFDVVQGQQYPIQILLTAGDGGTSLHLMIQAKQPDQPYLHATVQWDTYKQRPNPRIPLRFPVFALRPGISPAPYTAPPMNPPRPPPDEAPEDVKQSFERNGPGSGNPEVAPEPVVFPGVASNQ